MCINFGTVPTKIWPLQNPRTQENNDRIVRANRVITSLLLMYKTSTFG